MKPLSIFRFIKGSIKKILPLAITVCLAVSLLYFLSLIKSQLFTQLDNTTLKVIENSALVGDKQKGISQKDFNDIKENKYVRTAIPCLMDDIVIELVLGKGTSTSSAIFYVQKDDVDTLMKLRNAKLSEGELPKNRREILIHDVIAKQKNIKVGDVVKAGTKDIMSKEDVTVSGIIKADAYLCVGVEDTQNLDISKGNITAYVIGNEGTNNGLDQYIKENYSKEYFTTSPTEVQKYINNSTSSLNAVSVIILILLIVVIGVLLANISMIQYGSRQKEFELLHAIGFTKKRIGLKIVEELITYSIIGYIAGILLAILGAWLLNVCYWSDKGLDMPLIVIPNMVSTLILPIGVTLFGLIAPFKILKFKDIF